MQAYIGSKIILAEPMEESAFGHPQFKGTTPSDNQESMPGYHIQYSNPDGSKYDSWSPTNVFLRAYRVVSDDEKKLINQ